MPDTIDEGTTTTQLEAGEEVVVLPQEDEDAGSVLGEGDDEATESADSADGEGKMTLLNP